jgi:hypothetical protein
MDKSTIGLTVLLLAVATVASCLLLFQEKERTFTVGQRVTNGFCTGYIAAVFSNEYLVLDVNCGAISFNRVNFKKSETKEAL